MFFVRHFLSLSKFFTCTLSIIKCFIYFYWFNDAYFHTYHWFNIKNHKYCTSFPCHQAHKTYNMHHMHKWELTVWFEISLKHITVGWYLKKKDWLIFRVICQLWININLFHNTFKIFGKFSWGTIGLFMSFYLLFICILAIYSSWAPH